MDHNKSEIRKIVLIIVILGLIIDLLSVAIPAIITAIVSGFLGLGFSVAGEIINHNVENSDVYKRSPKDLPWTKIIQIMSKDIIKIIRRNLYLTGMFIITFLLMTSAAFAAVHPFWRTAAFFEAAFELKIDFEVDWKAGYKAFIQYHSNSKKISSTNTQDIVEKQPVEEKETQNIESKTPTASNIKSNESKTNEERVKDPVLKICYYVANPQIGITVPEEDLLEVLYNEQLNIDSAVKERFEGLFTLNLIEENIDRARDSKKRSSEKINEKEEDLKMISISNQENTDYKLWEKNLPDFSELEDLINGRKELLEKCNSGNLNWLVSNNYQRYALEYINRNDGNEERILFGYTNCILYAEQALTYNKYTKKSRKIILNYIRARYKDIADCERIDKFDDTIRPRARDIEIAIEKYINEFFTE